MATSHVSTKITAVGAENEYANVISQIGGNYVSVSAIMSNPNTDPHTFEASPSVASGRECGGPCDPERGRLRHLYEQDRGRVRRTRSVRSSTSRPSSTCRSRHRTRIFGTARLTMPDGCEGRGQRPHELRSLQDGVFQANVTKFDNSLKPWLAAISKVKSEVSERRRRDDRTGWRLHAPSGRHRQQDAVDPASRHHERRRSLTRRTFSLQANLFSQHKVKVFLYNQQVTDSLTATFLSDAKKAGIPVVGVYETMPTPGYNYQSWMLAEVNALMKALSSSLSTEKL